MRENATATLSTKRRGAPSMRTPCGAVASELPSGVKTNNWREKHSIRDDTHTPTYTFGILHMYVPHSDTNTKHAASVWQQEQRAYPTRTFSLVSSVLEQEARDCYDPRALGLAAVIPK